MLSFCFKFLIYSFGLLMAERHFRVTHMIYTIEPTKEIVQAPTPEPRMYVETVYKDPPPLPHPVVNIVKHFSSNSSNSTDGAGRHIYSQYHTGIKSDLTETPREIAPEDLKTHPEYRLKDEVDASEGRYEAKIYADRFRKISLRKEVHAVIVYDQPPQPPPYSVFRLAIPITLAISIVLVGFGILNFKQCQRFSSNPTSSSGQESDIPEHCRCYDSYFRTGPPSHWIKTYQSMQERNDVKIRSLKAKNQRLQEKLMSKFYKNRELRFKTYELRSHNDSLVLIAKDLLGKYKDMEKDVSQVKMKFRLALAIVEPEQTLVDRAMREANEGYEKYLKSLAKRRPLIPMEEMTKVIHMRLSQTPRGRRSLRMLQYRHIDLDFLDLP
jgi:hypothetical protein